MTLVAAFVVLVTVSTKATNRGGTLAQAGHHRRRRRCSCRARSSRCRSSASSRWPSSSAARAPTRSPRWARRVPGSPHEALALRAGLATSEVFPLTLFAVVGMMLFPAAGDLLTMFVALEVLSLPLYLLERAGSSTPPAVAGGLAEVLPARRVQLGVLPLRCRPALRLRRLPLPRRHRQGGHGGPGELEGLLLPGVVLVLVGLLFKVGAVPVPLVDARRLPGCPDPGDRLHGGLHQGRRVRRDPAGRLRRHRAPTAGTGAAGSSPSRP